MKQALALRCTGQRREPIAASYRTSILAALLIGLSIHVAHADDPYRACAPAIAVRTANPPGEADVVAAGPDGSLTYFLATPGGPWNSIVIPGSAGSSSVYSPAIAVHPDNGEVDVIAVGRLGLMQYWATPGSQWQSRLIGRGNFSSPAIALGANGDAHVAVRNMDSNFLMYYQLPHGSSAWIETFIGDEGLAFSSPAIAVRSTGEVDIAVQGTNNTLLYVWRAPTNPSWWRQPIAGATAITAPAIAVRESNPRPEVNIVTTGVYGSLTYYWATPGAPWFSQELLGTPANAASAPALVVRASGEADVVVRTRQNNLSYFLSTPGLPWRKATIEIPETTSTWMTAPATSAPAIAVRNDNPPGEADIVVRNAPQGESVCVDGIAYYWAAPRSPWLAKELPYPAR